MPFQYFLITAAPGWAADTRDVAAAILGAALAPAYSNQQEEEEATKDDEEYCEPVENNQLNFFVHIT